MTAVAFLGLGTMGYPMAGHLQREAITSASIIARRPRRCAGSRSTPDDTPIRRARPVPAPNWCSAASVTTTTCVPWRWASRAPSPEWRRAACSSTTPPLRRKSPASCRCWLPSVSWAFRRAGLRRPGGRGQRRPDGDGRWRGGLLSTRRTAAAQLCADGPANGRRGSGQWTKMVNQICVAGLLRAWPRRCTSPSAPVSTARRRCR